MDPVRFSGFLGGGFFFSPAAGVAEGMRRDENIINGWKYCRV